MSAAAAAKLPTVVIGGWLGAGKTTLVNHLLRHAGGRRVAVLVNDFGDVGIDADLIQGQDGAVLALTGGCLCCSFGDDLVGALAGLAQREPAPDMVLIETSGVALPAAVARSARLAPTVQWIGILVLADAGALRRQADDRYVGDTVRQQLRQADWLLLNKTDLVDSTELTDVQSWLGDLAPQAELLAGRATDLPPELVLGWRVDHADKADSGNAASFAARPMAPRTAHALSHLISISWVLDPGIDLAALGAALAAPGGGALRAKALVPDGRGRGRVLQVCAGRWQIDDAAAPRSAGALVLIGRRGVIDAPDYWLPGWLRSQASAEPASSSAAPGR